MTSTSKHTELTGDYILDTAHTRIGFIAKHTMGSRVCGQFDDFGGTAHLDTDPSKSNADLTIVATSISTGNDQRDEILRGKFLNAADHPRIHVTTIGIERIDEATFMVTSNLTIRGVTKPVTVDFHLTAAEETPDGEFRLRFRGSATIDRRDWDVNWNAATGLMVAKKVLLEFDIAAIRCAASTAHRAKHRASQTSNAPISSAPISP